jgi:hypothetical protein
VQQRHGDNPHAQHGGDRRENRQGTSPKDPAENDEGRTVDLGQPAAV